MKKIAIRLDKPERVRTFVNIVNRYHSNMDLVSGRYVVDAKSILGIFSLDLSRPLVLQVDDLASQEELEALLKDIAPFIVG